DEVGEHPAERDHRHREQQRPPEPPPELLGTMALVVAVAAAAAGGHRDLVIVVRVLGAVRVRGHTARLRLMSSRKQCARSGSGKLSARRYTTVRPALRLCTSPAVRSSRSA